MKKNYLSIATCVLAAALWSCSDNNTHGTTTSTDSSSSSAMTGNDTSSRMNNADTSMNSSRSANNTTGVLSNLDKSDREFILKAAKGGMMEVEGGKIAQQNAMNQRVKDFGGMMDRDHSKANKELMSLASSKGLTIPQDSLLKANQSSLDNMRKMTGKNFDSHYMSMMVSDHKKDISEFEKASKNAKDADLRNWATTTLPTLRMHLDSAQAISKAKM